MRKIYVLILLTLLSVLPAWGDNRTERTDKKYILPEEMYGKLFYDVMYCDSLFGPGRLFIEPKSFVDALPKSDPKDILIRYEFNQQESLADFIQKNFIIPDNKERKNTGQAKNIDDHIKSLWSVLTCSPDREQSGTLITMHYPYFVPGGRFREMYYWDSYFSMLGMICDRQDSLVSNMLENFADVINDIGFIPNGMRTYYLGRSQPPYFSFMIEDGAKILGKQIYLKYLPEMLKEHAFWMRGEDSVSALQPAFLRVVRMKDGELLNRYYDNYAAPRPEAFRYDIITGKELTAADPNADVHALFRNLRASAESGFDFSSRWMADGKNLYTLQTTSEIPVDLNCLMYHLETTIAKAYGMNGNHQERAHYLRLAQARGKAIMKYLWSEETGFFEDYVWSTGKLSSNQSIAGVYPLFCRIATKSQAKSVERTILKTYLKMGGVLTTPKHTGQQWDAPNGWAPLQWVTYKGLKNYNLHGTADNLKSRWMKTCLKVYLSTGKMMEKYDVERQADTGGGEYGNQTGFGWTNGVYRAMESDL